ncbi:MAG: hypothetical protein JWL72_4638 [Ilumatobacteraceae bacterium]|nr:hypothetical protein [Ilumatobacteraceae bacterium]
MEAGRAIVARRLGRAVRRAASSIAVAVIAASLSAVPGAAPASATSSGPCRGTVNAIDVSSRSVSNPDDAIRVGAHDVLDIVVTSAEPIGHYEVQLAFAGIDWTVAEGDADGTSWSKEVSVGDYSRFGVGLYAVHVVSGGSSPCSGGVLIRIAGSPFSSIAGWVLLAATGAGIGAVAMTASRRGRGFPKGPTALGAVGGLGAVGLVQQFALAAPTRPVVLIGVALGAVLPLIAQQVGSVLTKGPR